MTCSKNTNYFLILYVFILFSCGNQNNDSLAGTKPETSGPAISAELKIGGVYLLKNEDSTYYAVKILAIDDVAVHIRTYSNKFEKKPEQLNSAALDILIGHSPMDKKGFLMGNPELLKTEEVNDAELEGYKIYLEEMNKSK